MDAAYGNTILESSYDETVMQVDFVKLKVEKSEKKNFYLVFTISQPLVRVTNNFLSLAITKYLNILQLLRELGFYQVDFFFQNCKEPFKSPYEWL